MHMVPFQPAIEWPVAHTFEGKQQRQRHDFTGVESGLRVFLHNFHQAVYPAEEIHDRMFCTPRILPSLDSTPRV